MGQILTWIRGSRDSATLQDVAVEQQSQPGQATPKPAAQVSTVKPAQFETSSSGSAMAAKPGAVTTATGVGGGGGVTVGGSATAGTTTAPTSQVKAPTTVPAALSATSGKTAAAAASSGTTVPKAKESPKLSAQTLLAGTTVKPDANKDKSPLTAASLLEKTVQATPTQTKVQVEVPPAAAAAAAGAKKAPEMDPVDALASILPSADTIVRPEPVYTGPEVKEKDITSEKGVLCGEREETLPPGYRLGDLGPPPADWKPQDVPKPLSTDEALDSLSAGFMTSTTPSAPPKSQDNVDNIRAVSAGPTNFAKPPADKKAKMEKGTVNLAGITATPFKKTPPTEKKIKSPTVPLDAVSALSDLLPSDVPKPESPKLRPEDIVSEGKHKEEDAVLVGERDDSIHPEYRFNKEELEKLPAPKPEPTMGTGEALDILSGDFTSAIATPAICTPPPPVQKVKTPAADDFSLEAGLTSTTAKKVESSALPPAPTAAGNKTTSGPMSPGAIGALGDLLPADVPRPKEPEVKPEDMVSERKHKEEDAVLVGERDDTIHPNYRVTIEDAKKYPAPKPEPKMGTGEALDILSGGFVTSDSAPAVSSSAPFAKVDVEELSALDVLSGDFVAPSKASQAHAPLPSSAKTPKGDSLSFDALEALSDTLPADVPKPESPKLRPEDIVSEKKHKEKDAVLVGERDDTIHPNYRFNKEELEKLPAPKPEPTMATDDALDILSGDFNTPKAAPAVQAPLVSSTAPPTKSSADFALDALAGDFVTPSAAAKVESGLLPDPELELEAGADGALDALSDTLKDIKPAPQPEPALPKNIVDEKKAVEERLIKMGERDDTLPPEYRPTEEDLKKMAEAAEKEAAKPKPTLDDKAALDLLSMDFSAAPKPPAPTSTSVPMTKLQPPLLDSDPLKPMAGPVLESLSDTLLPDAPEFKSKTDKPKKHAEGPSAADLPAQPSSDVVSTSTKKGGKR
ncbi:unnamed protein product [Ophioblennius macclurei]